MSTATIAGYVRHAQLFGVELVFETAAGLIADTPDEPILESHNAGDARGPIVRPGACAEPKLSDRELGRLAVELRAIDPSWRLPTDAGDFATRLVAEGVAETAAARMAGISLRTLQRRQQPARKVLEQLAQEAKSRSEPAFQSGSHATNQGSEGNHPSGRQLSLSGTEARP